MAIKAYHHGNLAEECINVSLSYIRKGKLDFSLRQVAKDIGVSPNAPHKHFKNKEEIFAIIAERGFKELLIRFQNATNVNTVNTPEEKFINGTREYLLYALDHPYEYQIMMGGHIKDKNNHQSLYEESSKPFVLLLEVIGELQKAGKVTKGKTYEKGYAIWASLHGIATLAIEDNLYIENYALINKIPSKKETRDLALEIVNIQMKTFLKGHPL
ncbi:MAG: TetR/AcrR family transcriptional regulator [Oligoflexia bacterium]|nr:TetR/AcrR family transcriptional regulator [Bacteroidota bacterium]MCP4914901.1 TetR/AcrR family transcriptional regulator [Oligoflexia bacterium]